MNGITNSSITATEKRRCWDRIESNILVLEADLRRARSLLRTKKGEPRFAFVRSLAEWTGLEPATPGVTGRYSNQLNYHSCWWVLRGSNSRHSPCKGDALPTELSTRVGAVGSCFLFKMRSCGPAAVLLIFQRVC